MDIFKLIYQHDIRLDQLRERQTNRSVQETSATIEDFMRPDPTYSKFYITGTVLDKELFGLNRLDTYSNVEEALTEALAGYNLFFKGNIIPLSEALEKAEIGDAMILSKDENNEWNPDVLKIDSGSNVGHKKEELANVLQSDDLVLYKEHAHQGFDLHLFSRDNIYPRLFYPFQKLVGPQFRFFSINGRRIRSERQFYFETWTLDRPPHGAEEVFLKTQI